LYTGAVIAFVRVDNRLIHGQVVEAWLPKLKVGRVVVADDEAAQSPLIRAAMGLAVEGLWEARIEPLAQLDFQALASDPVRNFVLLRDVAAVMTARVRGLPLTQLNLGNVHYATGRIQISASVFLSPEELVELRGLAAQGVEVEARGVPSDRPVTMAEIEQKFQRTGSP
jgi:PTS system mannose-specific IIB component